MKQSYLVLFQVKSLGELVDPAMLRGDVRVKSSRGLERGWAKLALVLGSIQMTDFDVIDDRLELLVGLGTHRALEQAGIRIDFDQLLDSLLELSRGQVYRREE